MPVEKDNNVTMVLLFLPHVLQMLQWCVLAGFGMMHFLQKDTEGTGTLA